MFFFNTLKRIIREGEAKLNKLFQPISDQNAGQFPTAQPHSAPVTAPVLAPLSQPPPPFNNATKPNLHEPSCSNFSLSYWHPNFHPSTPIWTYFYHETGSHGWGNNELQNYTDSPVNSFFTLDHKLVIRAISHKTDLSPCEKFTSARLVSKQKLDRSLGCVMAKLTIPCAPGIWPAFWLLPAEPFSWPSDGEVDICETWNGLSVNHSCLHWGHYNAADSQKHRVKETSLCLSPSTIHEFALAWCQHPHSYHQNVAANSSSGAEFESGRLLWYLDGIPIMRASLPVGIRPMQDFRILLNIAMGGTVCQGTSPIAGVYDFVIHELHLLEEPYGGWQRFNWDWDRTEEGHTM